MLRVLTISLCFIVLLISLLRLDAHLTISKLLDKAEQVQQPAVSLTDSEKQDLEKVIENHFLSYRDIVRLSRIYSEIGETSPEKEQKLKYLCSTQLALQKALQAEPYNARSLVTWASVSQLLGSYQCPDSSKLRLTGSVAEPAWVQAVDLAVKSAPLDQQALFNAGLVLSWGKKQEHAYPIFYKVLELGTDTSVLQREVIYNLVQDADSLKKLIPAKIPQILEFIRYLKSRLNSNSLIELLQETLLELEIKALADFSQRFAREEIDEQIYLSRLSELWELARYSKSVNAIDRLFFEHYEKTGQKDLAKFFEQRFTFSEIEVLPGYKMADSRPLKSALSDWGSEKNISLDNFFSSLGFYLPVNTTVRRIELHSNSATTESVQSLIRILSSDDNQSWEDVTGLSSISTVIINSKTMIKIDLPGSARSFWKINYQNPGRNSKFNGKLGSIIRVFGIGA